MTSVYTGMTKHMLSGSWTECIDAGARSRALAALAKEIAKLCSEAIMADGGTAKSADLSNAALSS